MTRKRSQRHLLVILGVLGAAGLLYVYATREPSGEPAPATAAAAEQRPAGAALVDAADPGAPRADASERSLVGTSEAAAAAAAPAGGKVRDEPSVVIAVRTERGEPVAGAPVGLRVSQGGRARLCWRGLTQAPDGLVSIDRFRQLVAGSGPPLPAAVLAFPLAVAPAVPIDPAALPPEPVVLVLPATGRVEVMLQSDAAIPEDVQVSLAAGATESVQVTAGSGRALFPFVGLGLQLEVTAERPGQSQRTRVLAPGPQAAGETVVVQVPLAEPDWCIVVLHLTDETGTPCRDLRLDVRFDAKVESSHYSNSSSVTTDGTGTLRWVTDDGLGDGGQRTLHLRSATGEVRLAHLPLPVLRRGENDLGVVALLPPALVCSGTVVDAQGAPLAGASVRVQGRAKAGDPGWTDQEGLEATTDESGAFTVRGMAGAHELGVSAAATGRLPLPPQPFLLGATGLQLVLQQAAGLAGSVRLEEGLEPGDVVVELRRDSADEPLVERPAAGGAFEFASLVPGTAEVRVRLVGDLRGGVAVGGVLLRAGETARDGRLQGVDLLGGLHRIALTVVDAAGARVRDAEAVVLDGGGVQTAFEGILLPQGHGRLFARTPAVDLLVHAVGFRWTRVDGVVDGRQIALPRAAVVRLRLAPGLDAAGLRVTLSRSDPPSPSEGSCIAYHGTSGTRSSRGNLPWVGYFGGEVGTGGEVVLVVDSPGRYHCKWWLGRGSNVVRNARAEVRVGEQDTELLLDAGITATALAAARSAK